MAQVEPKLTRIELLKLVSDFTRQSPLPELKVSFYPYTNLKHTIRLRGDVIHVRISDLLKNAPHSVQLAIVTLLLARLFRRQASAQAAGIYREWSSLPEVRAEVRRCRQVRGSKTVNSPRGKFHDLRSIFNRINREYFADSLEVRQIGYSEGRGRRILGNYDADHDTITINRRLDSRKIPSYVVEFIVYHEMLHAALGDHPEGSNRYHHRRFREAERCHEHYERATHFIEEKLPSWRYF